LFNTKRGYRCANPHCHLKIPQKSSWQERILLDIYWIQDPHIPQIIIDEYNRLKELIKTLNIMELSFR